MKAKLVFYDVPEWQFRLTKESIEFHARNAGSPEPVLTVKDPWHLHYLTASASGEYWFEYDPLGETLTVTFEGRRNSFRMGTAAFYPHWTDKLQPRAWIDLVVPLTKNGALWIYGHVESFETSRPDLPLFCRNLF